ncbi:TPA: helix-turn-helix transcriptional regulator [Klebsiella oxytoca]|uniref:helix-turn-helix domain-containing transcriptional regulator n=1 Tax=Klebsiella TaxID=570 RepID=UPI0019635634|nr:MULTISPECIES: helix-turn-helix transcriptional regulator [Klebsiella]ELU0842414.1 helix-turn-helix transcriptional regulator [Klebsiella oxytoca]ELV3611225.1 helix-turn-helix transcriptional regulator [Klebsiella oxytoca]ELV3643674.1 helix-turn-helix transcriptional regulator [Klebsiella oxytoca]MBM9579835.1 helix-turn-helix transcriptional regulator [Klebsiella oxytoca]MBM9585392.1 helix-turn-helix transcriptional regulator [Klebsiella oxytoca]
MKALGGAIQQLAKERGMSLSTLADKIGINRKTLYSCIHGNPRLSGLQRIADGLGFRLSDIIAIAEEIEALAEERQEVK